MFTISTISMSRARMMFPGFHSQRQQALWHNYQQVNLELASSAKNNPRGCRSEYLHPLRISQEVKTERKCKHEDTYEAEMYTVIGNEVHC